MFDIHAFIYQFAILAVPVLAAITFHEVAHGYAAFVLGDSTAKNAGRLTLNPIKHLDPIGAIALFIVKIGWAKPVPIDPRNFKNPQQGLLITSLAGPVCNFILAIVFAIIFHGLMVVFGTSHSDNVINIVQPLMKMCQAGVIVNIGLGVFNLFPVPPLDGSNILAGMLPPKLAEKFMRNSKYGFIVLIILLVTGTIQKVIVPVIYGLASTLVPL